MTFFGRAPDGVVGSQLRTTSCGNTALHTNPISMVLTAQQAPVWPEIDTLLPVQASRLNPALGSLNGVWGTVSTVLLSFLLSLPHTALLNHVSGVHVTCVGCDLTRTFQERECSSILERLCSLKLSISCFPLNSVIFLFYPGHPSAKAEPWDLLGRCPNLAIWATGVCASVTISSSGPCSSSGSFHSLYPGLLVSRHQAPEDSHFPSTVHCRTLDYNFL